MTTIYNFTDFCAALLEAGFSTGGGNAEGIFNLVPYFSESIRWHTDDPETDPWEWRMRILEERSDIAYAKVFFRKTGFITREWYPYFLAARREDRTFEDDYSAGVFSHHAKRIYDLIYANGSLPMHEIKLLGGFAKEDNSKFERALVDLQMKMYITMCGKQQKTSRRGEEYGWFSTVFCTTEHFFGDEAFLEASNITKQDAVKKITARVYELNPAANEKQISKFICP